MADHPRLAILKAITAHLEGIVPAEGFTHTLTGRVWRGRTLFGDETPAPFLSIIEAPRPAFGVYAGEGMMRSEEWSILIQGFAKDDPENPTDPLYPLLADVELRLAEIVHVDKKHGNPSFPAVYMLPDADGQRQISNLFIDPPVTRPPSTEPVAKACFYLPLRIGLALGVG